MYTYINVKIESFLEIKSLIWKSSLECQIMLKQKII